MTKKQAKALKEKLKSTNKGTTLNVPKLIIAQNKTSNFGIDFGNGEGKTVMTVYSKKNETSNVQLDSSTPGFNHF